MELTQALDILKTVAASKQKEADSLNLAVSILEDKFTPELQVLDHARAEKEAEVAAHNETKTQLADEKAFRASDVSTLTAELTEKTSALSDAQAVLANLQTELEATKALIPPAETPAEPVVP